MESDPKQGGDQVTPNPEPSPQNPGGASAVDLKALQEALGPIISQEVDRRLQSQKDKRFAKLEGKVDETRALLERYENLRSKGMNQEDALFRLKVEDALLVPQEVQDAPSAARQTVSDRQPAAPELAGEVLEMLGLDADDVKTLQNRGASLNDYFTRAVDKRKAAQAPPNQAAVLPTGGGSPGQTSEEQLKADYQREISREGLSRSERLNIRDKYRRKGLLI
jgi:TolA-binding protein